ncbi:GGDEF domain-containing protein [Thioflavicoccus mobilis]|uniref:GGDEF domain-containing protein n=1 Tax=Thioflavicoccus mobilis TaxID=80679 RepID=UPI000685BD06|nr:GGDEF domain-containing protein [Thioflavicoccus mobilis]
MVADAAGTIVSVNPAFSDITGYGATDAVGKNASLLRSHRHDSTFHRAMWDGLKRNGCWQGEIWARRKNGEAYLAWLTINRVTDGGGAPIRYVGVFHDMTERHLKDEHIRYLAFHDALTGLPNRLILEDRLQHAITRAQRDGERLALLFIDLDEFKAINDRFGHDVGDLFLQEIAQRMKGHLRAADTAVRLGGDEFLVLMEGQQGSNSHYRQLADLLLAGLSRPMRLADRTVEVGPRSAWRSSPTMPTESKN